jgi:N-methylhydantoinase B
VAQEGAAVVRAYLAEIIDYTTRLTRAAIADLPDGRWSFEDWIDDDGVEVGQPIQLRVRVTVAGERITVDWTGSSPQVKGAINNTYSYTRAASYACVKSVLGGDIPNNEGFFRCVDVIAPPGTIANAVLPAACAARGLTGFRMVDCLFGALAPVRPERVFAASEGGNTGISIGGYDAERRPFIYVDFLCSGWGGRAFADGVDGNANLFANVSLQPVEVLEREQPLEIPCFTLIPDTGGPGRFRGAMALRRDYHFLEDEAVLQVRADRQRFRPYGLFGGQPGQPSQNCLNPGTAAERILPGKPTMTIHRGDVFRHTTAGAGGWGDPFERDPAAVARDVHNELVSLAAAREAYGVVIDPETGAVDLAATAKLRGQERSPGDQG